MPYRPVACTAAAVLLAAVAVPLAGCGPAAGSGPVPAAGVDRRSAEGDGAHARAAAPSATGMQHHAGSGPAAVSNAGGPPSAAPAAPGTAAMAKRLADMAAAVDVRNDPWSSLKRLELALAGPVPPDVPGQLVRLYHIGVEQLNAGKPDEAAVSFQDIQHVLSAKQAPWDSAELREITSLLAVSWLRWGEIQNCAVNHNADSCIFPLKGGGIHADPSGAEKAIPELEMLTRTDPNDLTDRWVLNIAHMARGTWPDGLRAQDRIGPEVFASQDDIGRFLDVAPRVGMDVAGRAGGVIVDDFTGDGNLDVLSSSTGISDPLHFFVSRGDGTFEDRSAAAGLTGLTGGLNLVQADYDGDGWLDALVLRGAWRDDRPAFPNSLLRNRGDGTFEDVTEAAGMLSFNPTQSGDWADYDNDGDLDLFVANETHPGADVHHNELWRNEGDGTFKDVAAAVGVDVVGFNKAGVWGDYDNDGRVDLFVSRLNQPNVLWHNDGPTPEGGWRFRDVTAAAGVAGPVYSFPAWWWDYDDDGRLDLMVCGYGASGTFGQPDIAADVLNDYLGAPTPAERLHLYHNQGDGTFENVAAKAGVNDVVYAMGANFGDFDNDGWEDFYLGTGNADFRSLMPNRAWRSAGDGTFRDITTSGGLGHLQKGHGISFADLDNDGDQDVYADLGGAFEGDWYPNVLFENPGHGRHWVTLRLSGPGRNPSAIGARVAVRVATPRGARTLHRVVGSGASFGANSLQVELGLGDAMAIEAVEVAWPGTGASETFAGVDMDAIWRLAAGTGQAQAVRQATFALGGGARP